MIENPYFSSDGKTVYAVCELCGHRIEKISKSKTDKAALGSIKNDLELHFKRDCPDNPDRESSPEGDILDEIYRKSKG